MDNQKRKKFIITMVIIMACATMVNYGLYNILNTYFVKPSETYGGVQLNIASMLIIIVVVTVIMLVLIPKENVNEIMASLEMNGSGAHRTPEQQLQDMIDDELSDK